MLHNFVIDDFLNYSATSAWSTISDREQRHRTLSFRLQRKDELVARQVHLNSFLQHLQKFADDFHLAFSPGFTITGQGIDD